MSVYRRALRFDNFGLSIGLIQYSFMTSGKELFENFKENLFAKYRRNIRRLANNSGLHRHLYMPAGYRMFGSRGLAILSLMDDYAFGNRIFNPNHHKACEERYDARIITAIAESNNGNYLLSMAKKTFLKKNGRFPFVGIMKMKVDPRLLRGRGIFLIRSIKDRIQNIRTEFEQNLSNEEFLCKVKTNIELITVECFDNDEMAVIVFSNSMSHIYRLMRKIKCMKYQDLDRCLQNQDRKKEKDRHVFSSCHINLGYDVEFNFEKASEKFLPCSGDAYEGIKVEFMCEVKPGHDDEKFKKIFPKSNVTETRLTGGNKICCNYSVKQIHRLEHLCEKKKAFSKNVTGVEISLSHKTTKECDSEVLQDKHLYYDVGRYIQIDNNELEKIKSILNKNGIPKVVRERLLSLFRLYNRNSTDLLHAFYLKELKGALESVKDNIQDLIYNTDVSIQNITDEINRWISYFEGALYNRFIAKSANDTMLEYNGGVQQWLTSYDFVYKQINHVLLPLPENKRHEAVYVSVVGAEGEHSTSQNLQLNINQITYPELFVYSVWKEASNYSHPVLEEHYTNLNTLEQKEVMHLNNRWRNLINSDEHVNKIRTELREEGLAESLDDIYRIILEFWDKRTMKYCLADQIVHHFCYLEDFPLNWHFYWKGYLQSERCFARPGEVAMIPFVHALLRILIIGLANDKKEFIREQWDKPFDSSLSGAWHSCFLKVLKCAEIIYRVLERHNFNEVNDNYVASIEETLCELTPYMKAYKQKYKKCKTDDCVKLHNVIAEKKFKPLLDAGKLVEPKKCQIDNGAYSPDFVVCILNSFLQQVMVLDEAEGKIISKVPRGGEHHDIEVILERPEEDIKDIYANMFGRPSDQLGGFFTSDFETRKKYFVLCTAFHKSLWHYRQIADDPIDSKMITAKKGKTS